MTEKKHWQIADYPVIHLLFVGIIAAFEGYLIENGTRAVTQGIIDDRHQYLPFLFAYDLVVLVMYGIFDRPSKMRFFGLHVLPKESKKNRILRMVIYYVSMFVIVTVFEMLVGLGFEALGGGVRPWDYTKVPLHITPYTSVPTSLTFAAIILVFMEWVFPWLIKLCQKIPAKVLVPLTIVLTALLVIDWLQMLLTLAITGDLPDFWAIYLPWYRG